jgi:hypothetical protein
MTIEYEKLLLTEEEIDKVSLKCLETSDCTRITDEQSCSEADAICDMCEKQAISQAQHLKTLNGILNNEWLNSDCPHTHEFGVCWRKIECDICRKEAGLE